ncbi:MAG: GntR family transcriptional regulator [Trueperaceae bacterium]
MPQSEPKVSLSDYRTVTDGVYAVLRKSIVHGQLKPGRSLRENALAKELGVSRTPVREAIRRLESEGLLTFHPRMGLVVTQFSRKELAEIYYIREALEGMSARLAATSATPIEIATLQQLYEDMRRAHERGNVDAMVQATSDFHHTVCEASGNVRLLNMISGLRDQLRQVQPTTLLDEARRQESLQDYRELLAAIESRDPDRAESAMRSHRKRILELRLAAGSEDESIL